MKLALLTGTAAALSLAATASAQAETIVVSEPIYGAPAYAYEQPVPLVAPGYLDDDYVVAAPRTIVVERPPAYVIRRGPAWIDRDTVIERPLRYRSPRRIEVQYPTAGSCVMDSNGIERCY